MRATKSTIADFAARIVGESLSSVTFVQDYVQLRFDGPSFSFFTSVCVRIADRVWRPEDCGWRDSLCGRITHAVRAVWRDDSQMCIDFDDDSSICISLRDEDYRGPEAVNYIDGERIVVF